MTKEVSPDKRCPRLNLDWAQTESTANFVAGTADFQRWRPARQVPQRFQPYPSRPRFEESHDCASSIVSKNTLRTDGWLRGSAPSTILMSHLQSAAWRTL
jgi:hypothetical protein